MPLQLSNSNGVQFVYGSFFSPPYEQVLISLDYVGMDS